MCTLTVGCYEPEWLLRSEETVRGADPSYMFTKNTEAECLYDCFVNYTCVGVDVNYNLNPKECWPHFSRSDYVDGNVFGQPGTNSYELITRCGTTTAAATTRR